MHLLFYIFLNHKKIQNISKTTKLKLRQFQIFCCLWITWCFLVSLSATVITITPATTKGLFRFTATIKIGIILATYAGYIFTIFILHINTFKWCEQSFTRRFKLKYIFTSTFLFLISPLRTNSLSLPTFSSKMIFISLTEIIMRIICRFSIAPILWAIFSWTAIQTVIVIFTWWCILYDAIDFCVIVIVSSFHRWGTIRIRFNRYYLYNLLSRGIATTLLINRC